MLRRFPVESSGRRRKLQEVWLLLFLFFGNNEKQFIRRMKEAQLNKFPK